MQLSEFLSFPSGPILVLLLIAAGPSPAADTLTPKHGCTLRLARLSIRRCLMNLRRGEVHARRDQSFSQSITHANMFLDTEERDYFDWR